MSPKLAIKPLHSWKLSLDQAQKIQKRLAKRLILNRVVNPRLVAGADCSYSKTKNLVYSAVVVYDLVQDQVVDKARAKKLVWFPYIPGYLSFREGPALLRAFQNLKTQPDAIIFDGQGIAHPRRMGIASHLGLWLEIPSLGCAKSRFYGEGKEPGLKLGSWEWLWDGKEVIGARVRTKTKVKPVFISPGHLMGLESALQIVFNSLRGYRLPEPLRLAHLEANRFREEEEE